MDEPQAVGYVVGEVQTDAFTFVTNPDIAPPRLEYVVVSGVRERVGDEVRTVDVLAQVVKLSVNSRLLSTGMNFNEVEAILRRLGASPPVVVGQAKVLGYLDGRQVRIPRGAAMPGAAVTRAPDDLLRSFFSHNVTSGINIGALINRPAVEVMLDPNGLRRHLAVIAQTVAGKSNTVGGVLEKLLQLGGTVVVFDPNSDYVLLRRTPNHGWTSFAERVQVYRLPSEQQSRISDEEIGETRRMTIQFSRLELEEICELAGIPETFANIRKALKTAFDNLSASGRDYTPDHLVDELERIASLGGFNADAGGGSGGGSSGGWNGREADAFGLPALDVGDAPEPAADSLDADDWFGTPEDRARRAVEEQSTAPKATPKRAGGGMPSQDAINGAGRAVKYIEFLAAQKIWGFQDVPLDDLLRPMMLSTVDLAGTDRKIADFVVTKLVREIWNKATRDGLTRPVFLVLEEAHNFVPSGAETGHAAKWIKRIASEGRKFGIFLVLITQRPYRVHQDTLSQCGSQIIMRLTNPEDQNAVRRASESISEDLLSDLPGLNVGEAVVLGPLTRVPVMVRVGQRESQEGGSDIDVVERLEAARAEAVTDGYVAAHKAEKTARGRSPWREEF
jgi:DNA helicase HerA-like ATPase